MVKKIKGSLKGFTLIELLVVIAIIGILSTSAMVSLNGARSKARDALRKGDMAQMRTALNLYYDDHEAYPSCGVVNEDEDDDYGSRVTCYTGGSGTLEVALTGGTRPYMSNIPTDPKNTSNDLAVNSSYVYKYVSNGIEYVLIYHLEDGDKDVVMRGW